MQAAMAAATVYGVASLLCFAAYALDKSAARRGARRTPERSLLLLGLVGGWPGGLLAQRWLRHKSVKPSFQLKFWLTVLLNLAAAALLAATVLTDTFQETHPPATTATPPAV
ncbi:DUF1294 domain-containing protein [Duganella callida]|uniref:DUF1294 domain-containing protein n=1 Tax=Duganella callida TaxID=2561932 RepID=A0A4Y9S1D4_9BURK|nr:DUF1294 domain-containing protein [Duganella callida]TFW13826.1 DUF1294 domain-containing protein [Duganella callida]